MFEDINLQQFFHSEINVIIYLLKNICSKLAIDTQTIAQNFP